MKVCVGNPLKVIRNIVYEKARFQKVMLLFDEYVSNVEIGEIYEEIKDFCVYNHASINELDVNELFNGYRLIIFFCSIDSMLKCDFNRDEFINIFFLKDNAVLPCFLDNNNIVRSENNYLISNQCLDLCSISSMYFNSFIRYFKDLLLGKNKGVDINFFNQEITSQTIFDLIQNMGEEQLVDINILKSEKISYFDLVIVHFLILDAILVLIDAIKTKNVMLVDVYKSAKDDNILIEKFYRLFNSEVFKNVVILNYNCLHNYCIKTKSKILELMSFFDVDERKINLLVSKIKNYSKYDNDLLVYLYLYNIFSV